MSRPSTFRTYSAPPIGEPSIRISTACDAATRILVRNLDPQTPVLVSSSATELDQVVPGQLGGQFYIISPVTSEVLVLNARQFLFLVSSNQFPAVVSVAQSDAFPVKIDQAMGV